VETISVPHTNQSSRLRLQRQRAYAEIKVTDQEDYRAATISTPGAKIKELKKLHALFLVQPIDEGGQNFENGTKPVSMG
jgi:hypothetical protein